MKAIFQSASYEHKNQNPLVSEQCVLGQNSSGFGFLEYLVLGSGFWEQFCFDPDLNFVGSGYYVHVWFLFPSTPYKCGPKNRLIFLLHIFLQLFLIQNVKIMKIFLSQKTMKCLCLPKCPLYSQSRSCS